MVKLYLAQRMGNGLDGLLAVNLSVILNQLIAGNIVLLFCTGYNH